MDKQTFIDAFVGTFLASYAASKYDDACMTGISNNLVPIEDAIDIAEDAWTSYEAYIETDEEDEGDVAK